MTCIFVSGTDTDVGKTFVAGALYDALRREGVDACYWKPVQTGNAQSDANTILAATEFPEGIKANLVSYPTPRAPDQAAQIDRQNEVFVNEILADYKTNFADQAFSVIEGAGGLLVPLNQANETWCELLQKSSWPVLLVARTTLGTINHTALSIQALQQRGIKLFGVVLNGEKDEPNRASLQRMFPDVRFFDFPKTNVGQADYLAAGQKLAKSLLASIGDNALPEKTVAELDEAYVWHPYTQHQLNRDCLEVRSARGVWLELADGRKIFDASGSWWVNSIGHARPEIANAIAQQQQKLDHVLFGGLTHEPAAKLAQKICEKTKNAFQKVFFSDNGSTAVEVALKIAFQGFANKGERRGKFLALSGSYHGDTIACMSVGGGDGFSSPYAPLLFACERWIPKTSHPSKFNEQGYTTRDKAEKHLRAHGSDYAALIVEPLIQGAGGMLMHDEDWLRDICQLARDFSIPVIFDEVFTGMGRSGDWFAFQTLNWTPDIICLAKGLTGGNLPLALTVTTDKHFSNFLDQSKAKALLHGHSFTANPIACAAALATLEIYEKEGLCARARDIQSLYETWIEEHRDHIKAPRCKGAVLAFELKTNSGSGYFNPIAQRVSPTALEHGLWLRPLGDTIYVAPPLASTNTEIGILLNALSKTIAALSV